MSPTKRDNSQLEWHYKRPTKEELSDPYVCFPESMWSAYFQAAKEASTLSASKRSDPEAVKNDVKKAACEDCSLVYQSLMQQYGLCNPIEGAVTPKDKE